MNHLHGIFNFETYDFDYVNYKLDSQTSSDIDVYNDLEVVIEHSGQTFLEL